MRQASEILSVKTPGRGLVEVTDRIVRWAGGQDMTTGLLTIFCRHTSASLLIQENAAPEVREDLEAFFEQVAPEDPRRHRHDDEGPDDMPAHLRAALTGVSLAIPLIEARLQLGSWQGVYVFEHRRDGHRRELALHLMGE